MKRKSLGLTLSLWNVEALIHERSLEVCHEPVRYWGQRFGPMFAAEIHHKPSRTLHGGNTSASMC